MIALASGETGSNQKDVQRKAWAVAVIANGLGPLRVLKSATSGADLDELRDGPLTSTAAVRAFSTSTPRFTRTRLPGSPASARTVTIPPAASSAD